MTADSFFDRLRRGEGAAFHAGYGAVVTVLLSFIPFSSVLGGAVAAFRDDRGYLGGFGLGLVAGVFAAVPLAALFVPAMAVAGTLGFGVPPSSPAYGVFLGLVGLFFLVYTVGFSGLGGVVGVWIRRNTEWDLTVEQYL